MAIYMQLPNIAGNVTTKNYQDWIELTSSNFIGKRFMTNGLGSHQNREAGMPFIGELELTKKLDKASPLMLAQLFNGKTWDKVNIVAAKGADPVKPYAQYILHDVMVGHFEEMLMPEEAQGLEFIRLNFCKMEKSYIPHNAQGVQQSPISTGYDLSTAQVL